MRLKVLRREAQAMSLKRDVVNREPNHAQEGLRFCMQMLFITWQINSWRSIFSGL